jgi:hypothetical protein
MPDGVYLHRCDWCGMTRKEVPMWREAADVSSGAVAARPVTVASDHLQELQPLDHLPDARSANPEPGTQRRDRDARLGVNDLDGAQLPGGQTAAVSGGREQTVNLAAHATDGRTSSGGPAA